MLVQHFICVICFVFLSPFTNSLNPDLLLKLPEFVGPIKNISAPYGSNVDFSCDIINQGSYRIIWLRRDGEKNLENLLGINSLRVSTNERIKISLKKKSASITQSNLYIYSINKEDFGEYECALNTNPARIQKGILSEYVETNGIISSLHPLARLKSHSSDLSNKKNLTTDEKSKFEIYWDEESEINKTSEELETIEFDDAEINYKICINLDNFMESVKKTANSIVEFFYETLEKIKNIF